MLWVGTRNGGVYKWNPATWSFGHFTRMASNPDGLADKTVTSFAEDRIGRIWIGTFGGLHVMDRQTGEIHRFGSKAGAFTDRVMALGDRRRRHPLDRHHGRRSGPSRPGDRCAQDVPARPGEPVQPELRRRDVP